MVDKRFGAKINGKRKDLGLKTEDLAIECGIEPGYLRQILAGRIPSGQVIIKLCEVLKLSPNYLFDFAEDTEDKEIINIINKLTSKEKRLVLSLLKFYAETNED